MTATITQPALWGTALDEAFATFHENNPDVYEILVRLARRRVSLGHQRIGIGMLYEVARWELTLDTVGDTFTLNNNYRSRYARLIMEREPDLADVFETRELRS